MSASLDFRAVLIKIQDLLSDKDRERLHFLLGDDIPRCLRDDSSMGGALRVLESLLEKAIISNQDCDYLIEAFMNIHCRDAAKRLKGLFLLILTLHFVLNRHFILLRISKKSSMQKPTNVLTSTNSIRRQRRRRRRRRQNCSN
jgi:hypothetical protein